MSKPQPETEERIALYGSLMRGLGEMSHLAIGDGLAFIGPALIPGELFDLGAYPGLCHGSGRVVGELYEILDVGIFDRLDEFEGVLPGRPAESMYLREEIQLIEPADARAWIYVYNETPAPETRINSGDWRVHLAERTACRIVR